VSCPICHYLRRCVSWFYLGFLPPVFAVQENHWDKWHVPYLSVTQPTMSKHRWNVIVTHVIIMCGKPTSIYLPSELWCCWLGIRKVIRPVKNWVVGCWHGYLSGASCRLAYGPADAAATQCLVSVKSRLVLPFWYWLTQVVPEKGPLNECVCTLVCLA